MKLILSLLVALSATASGTTEERNLQDTLNSETCPAEVFDKSDCPIPEYTICPDGMSHCDPIVRRLKAAEQRNARNLQLFTIPPPAQDEYADNVPLPYAQPCYNPSRNNLNDPTEGWSKWNLGDDDSQLVNLTFPFDFFDVTHNSLWLNDNGFVSFVNTFMNNWQPSTLPSGLQTAIIAPFWADVQTENQPGGRGNIFYKDFGDHFVVIWDEVGHYTAGTTPSFLHNSFQMVISKTPTPDAPYNRNPELNNVCFCYLDMGWTHGDRDGTAGFEGPRESTDQSRSATIGVTNGLADPFGRYGQIGRFNTSGTMHNGVVIPSGVDWLDDLGAMTTLQARAGFCFNTGPNLPPIFKAGAMEGQIKIPCSGNLPEFKVYFGTPEVDQHIVNPMVLSQPNPAPEGLTVTVEPLNDAGNLIPDDTIGFRFEWLDPDHNIYGGQSFTYVLKVCDDHPSPLCTVANVTISLATCGSGADCIPDKCTNLTETSTCAADVKALCTPWRSPEHCDALVSFPTLISNRYPMIKDSLHSGVDTLGDDGYWFHYTDDRAGAYAFTTGEGYAAPDLYCCVTNVDELLGAAGGGYASSLCFGGSNTAWNGAYVIRAEGHHSGTGVFVLPEGLDNTGGTATTELATGSGTITMAAVRSYLEGLSPTPKKILVEKFVSGNGVVGPTSTLPNEYKFHMFNGKIGSISTFLNRGTDCACYGEYSEDWECLHKHGCFVPNFPMGTLYDDSCYLTDYNAGSLNPYPVKGFDLCGPVPRPDACIFDRMKEIAIAVSKTIGVYVRIDMFVTDAGEIYIQEYTFNHLGGTRHCAAKKSDMSDCIDSCFLGKCWYDISLVVDGNQAVGGVNTTVPTVFDGSYGVGTYGETTYGGATDADQCGAAIVLKTVPATTTCSYA